MGLRLYFNGVTAGACLTDNMEAAVLVGEELVKEVAGQTLLNRVSLAVQPGKAIALIGPNGAGKTVLLHALSLADPPTSGRVVVDDDLYRFPDSESGKPPPWPTVTVVFQQLFLWPHMT